MTRKATIAERTRVCPVCKGEFVVDKPSRKQRYCSHSCAFVEIGEKVRTASRRPESIKKMADALRGRGESKTYMKLNGRHMHRVVAEQKIGRLLEPGEIAHHTDLNKRNNDPENLEILPSRADHSRLHSLGTKRPPKAVCKYGHLLVGDNVLITSTGRRRCRTCARTYDTAWHKAKRQSANSTERKELQ